MRDTDAAFLWWVQTSGYAWVDAPLIDESRYGGPLKIPARGDETMVRVLVPNLGEWRESYPLDLDEETPLFRHFAELDLSGDDVDACEETVRQFADHYGDLGIGVRVLVRQPGEVGPLMRDDIRPGADLATWRGAQWVMRWAVKVWDALQAGDTTALERWFPVTKDGLFRTSTFTPDEGWPSPTPEISAGVQFVDDRLAREVLHQRGSPDPADHHLDWPPGSVHWAMAYLRRWITEQLGRHTGLRMRWDPESPDKAPLRLGVVPENVLGVMWWQLAVAIDGALRYERCAECGEWFHVKPRGNRPNTRFCSGYCRLRAFREGGSTRKGRKTAATR